MRQTPACILVGIVLILCSACAPTMHGPYDPQAPLTARQTIGAACLGDRIRLPQGVLIGASEDALPGVWHILDSYSHEAFHRGAVVVLGHIGKDEDARRLEAWITDPTRFAGLLEHLREDNFHVAFVSLGMMWARGSGAAEKILRDMVMRDYWKDRDIQWWADMSDRPLSNTEETLCWVLHGSSYGGGDMLVDHTDLISKANQAALERLDWRVERESLSSRRNVMNQPRPLIDRDLRLSLESTFAGSQELPTPLTEHAEAELGERHFKQEILSEAWAVYRAYATKVRTGQLEALKYRFINPAYRKKPFARERVDQYWPGLKANLIESVKKFDALVGEGWDLSVEYAWSEVEFPNYIPSGIEISEQRRLDRVISQADVCVTIQLVFAINRPVEPPTGEDNEWSPFEEGDEPKLYMLRKDGVWYWYPYED